MKCFYHSADLDGNCSGFLVKYVIPNMELIGINYGDEFPWDKISEDESVFMVDFSLQPFNPHMINLAEKCSLIWIDHHKSAIEEYEAWLGEFKGIQRSGIGACALVWEYLWQDSYEREMPTFIKLLADYDVWNHSDPRTLPFQWGMRQYDTNPENQEFWEELFDVERVQQITEEGGLILKYQQAENEKYIKACGFDLEFEGLKCVAVNKMLTNSMLFTSVWDPEKYDAMLTFGWRNGQWTISLYSDKPAIDVSGIAKNRGGGGHKGAAGFQCRELPFELK
jgi:oligoribonuclease NrnB/cAMP/cGMP phosphodiesterase (DHH superfamily)